MTVQKKIIDDQLDIKIGRFPEEKLEVVLKKTLQISTKYLQRFGRNENLTTYFSEYAILSIIKIQLRNGRKAASSPSLRNHKQLQRHCGPMLATEPNVV